MNGEFKYFFIMVSVYIFLLYLMSLILMVCFYYVIVNWMEIINFENDFVMYIINVKMEWLLL